MWTECDHEDSNSKYTSNNLIISHTKLSNDIRQIVRMETFHVTHFSLVFWPTNLLKRLISYSKYYSYLDICRTVSTIGISGGKFNLSFRFLTCLPLGTLIFVHMR